MDPLALATMSMHPVDKATKDRQHAEKVAGQFEAIFVKSMVSSLRQTGACGSEGGMFGDGPGAETYADWFDENFADQLGKTDRNGKGGIGIRTALMAEFERSHEVQKQPKQAAADQAQIHKAFAAADRAALAATTRTSKGGLDVLQ